MSEMIERLAKRAMRDGYLNENDTPEEVERCWQAMDGVRETCLVMTRAVLQELRDNPTEAIVRASLAYEHEGDGDDLVRRDWRAMIDAVLNGA